MAASHPLDNFSERVSQFLGKLAKNNNKEWFEAHRDEYESELLEPAQAFVEIMGAKLRDIAPDVHAIPKIDKSIFRMHRDVRFSKDKSPYKQNLGLFFWEGSGKKMECPGFYFHLEKDRFFIGVGIYMFPKEILKRYRDAAADPVKAVALTKIIKKLEKKYTIGSKTYKQIPRGYQPDPNFEDLMLHSGLTAMIEGANKTDLFGHDPISLVYKHFKAMLPLHQWLLENTR